MSTPPVLPGMRRPQKKSGTPWVLFGCLAAIGVLVFLLIALFVGARVVVRGVIENYTDAQPMELPVSAMPADQYASLEARVKSFQKAINEGTPVEPLDLTSDDINALIHNDPEWKELKGRVHVSMDGDLVTGTVSIPLAALNVPGRYLNGSGTFAIFLHSGALFIQVDSLEVKGKPLPEEFMAPLRSENWAKNVNQDPEARKTFAKFKKIEVSDSVLHIIPMNTP